MPLFRDLQDRIHELADVLKPGNGVESSAGRIADEEMGAIREDGYGMGAERHVHAHAQGGIVVAQRLPGVGPYYRHSPRGLPRVIDHCGFAWTSCCGRNWRGKSARAETTLFQVRAQTPFSSSSRRGNGW